MLDFWDYLIYTSYIASFEVLSLFKTIKLPLGAVRVKPEKASRIKARDTQTTSPDPWSIVYSDIESRCILEFLPMDLGSVIIDCGDKHYNTRVCGIPSG